MFASFTSILSPALKEKLGIGPKPSPHPDTFHQPAKPLTLPNNRTMRPLSPALQTEVQSPGFSSRVISQVREGAKPKLSDPGLSPLSMSVSTRYSRVGQLPVVTLTKRQLPRLTSRNSEKVGRREGRAPVMMRIAPQEPFSPFKRYSGSAERGVSAGRGRESQSGGSTDPRQVIAVLAELSGKRTRRPSDDLSITGSKRARRDSSSSLGSSLSMEMPPLFQNGVVGQSTSHLVSREADLSLGSLLSRNQSLFGHSPLTPHHSHPMPPTSHHHSPPTANAQSQTVTAKPDTSTDQSLSLEIQASLSSSRCLLKRNRDQLEEDSEDEENIPTPKASNIFRSPDKDRDSAIRKRRVSSDGSFKSHNSTLVDGANTSGSPDNCTEEGNTVSGVSNIIVASPAEILGTPAPKRRRTGQVIGEKELKGERELQRKRLGKMLDIFPDQTALSSKESVKEVSEGPRQEEISAPVVTKSGGFPFTLGEKFDAPPPAYDSGKGGFPFAFASKHSNESSEVAPVSSSEHVAAPTISSASTNAAQLSTSTTSTVANTTIISSTTTSPDLVTKVVAKPATVTFNLSDSQPAEVVKPKAISGLPVPTFNLPANTKVDSATSTSTTLIVASTTGITTTAPTVFTFGTKTDDTSKKPIEESSAVPFTFGAANIGGPAVSAAPVSVPETTTAPHVFSFGASQTTEASKTLAAPTFNLGGSVQASSTASVTSSASSTFSFGQSSLTTTAPPAFGSNKSTAETKPFSFGVTTVSSTKTEISATATSSASGLFTFSGVAASSSSAPTFGASVASTTTTAVSVAAVSPFTFGAAITTAPATTAAGTPGLFTFGSTPAKTTAPPPFGAVTSVTVAPSFGSAVAPTPASTPSFSFGGASATTTTAASTGGTFTFGVANPTPATTQSTPFAFGKASTEPPKPSFSFGGNSGAGTQAAASNNPFGAAAPAFGASSTSSGFGTQATNAFGAQTATSTSVNAFGAASVTKSASTGNVFNFGKSQTQTVAAASSPFTFGAANPSQPPSAPSAASPFQFGASSSTPAKPSFSFGGNAKGPTGNAPSFGASTAASPFGSPATSTATGFGSTPAQAPTQQTGVFSFGNAAAPTAAPAANSSTGFNFSAAPQTASGVFNFGAAAAAPAANPFGAPTNPGPAFGAPSTNFGSASGNFGAPAPAAGGNMFSIGAGGQQNRSSNSQRRIATARRTRK